MASHKETRRLSNIQISLDEAQELLDLMKKGVKKVDESITVYCGGARVEAEDPSDLSRYTVVSDVVKSFVLEARAGEPYEERVLVDCLTQGVVTIEVEGHAEEWVCGRVNIVARYLYDLRRPTRRWLSAFGTFWLIACAVALFEAGNYLLFAHPTDAGLFRILRAASPYVRWGATAMVITFVAKQTTAPSLLHVRPTSTLRKNLSRDVLVPVASGLIANLVFYFVTKLYSG